MYSLIRNEKKFQIYDKLCDDGNDKIEIEHIATLSGFKYALRHKSIKRKLEVFHVHKDYINLVCGFHVSPVNAYYEIKTNTTYGSLPYWLSLKTGVSPDMKWFSCNKVPPDIILKNIQRGYSLQPVH